MHSHTVMEVARRLRGVAAAVLEELVDEAEKLAVLAEITNGETMVVITVRTAKNDVGKVIGKKGRNAESLRTLLESVAARNGLKVLLEIDDKMRR